MSEDAVDRLSSAIVATLMTVAALLIGVGATYVARGEGWPIDPTYFVTLVWIFAYKSLRASR